MTWKTTIQNASHLVGRLHDFIYVWGFMGHNSELQTQLENSLLHKKIINIDYQDGTFIMVVVFVCVCVAAVT